ncbi:DUF4183 domain-containing protein [Paenibacillus guangzhouensis]|uniref:DUF4183 domain-containing protein n=1 Tax=Paenibacillus guangzhouensis TaxID=1473112 RepID=UPI001266C60B|nr:DUF4183 domain-containing protein [Paenibacillus guangzhouensis]
MNEISGAIRITSKPWIRNNAEASSCIPSYSIFPPLGCSIIFPSTQPPPTTGFLKVETFQYITVSDGVKNTYTNLDGLTQFDSSVILNPNTVSYMNLFINGILQPFNVYKVSEGILTINSVQENGVPITLQFIRVLSN